MKRKNDWNLLSLQSEPFRIDSMYPQRNNTKLLKSEDPVQDEVSVTETELSI
jgi:hypothetical protein